VVVEPDLSDAHAPPARKHPPVERRYTSATGKKDV
jgi:hypothetical protein